MAAGCSQDAPSTGAQSQATQAAAHPEQQALEDLVLANRMLASDELDIPDTAGHVSVRSRINPDHYYVSRYVAPGIVTVSDIIENDLDSPPSF